MTLPVLFLGHGSPMNALADNDFTRSLHGLRASLGKPRAVLVISAHWSTEGTFVTHMAQPRTIHDFYGFPQRLFDVRYGAPGSPHAAEKVRQAIPAVQLDDETLGLDHGTWSVLRHVFPEADLPVIQLSLDLSRSADWHFELGEKLRGLRDQGILIVGSGNIVHNLHMLRWEESAEPYAWAVEFDAHVKKILESGRNRELAAAIQGTEAARLSVPTAEHYLPLLYVAGAAREEEKARFVFEGIQNSSISMRSVIFGA